jgi:hypothetical protein
LLDLLLPVGAEATSAEATIFLECDFLLLVGAKMAVTSGNTFFLQSDLVLLVVQQCQCNIFFTYLPLVLFAGVSLSSGGAIKVFFTQLPLVLFEWHSAARTQIYPISRRPRRSRPRRAHVGVARREMRPIPAYFDD